ncbi:MAG: hypothetical protein M3Q47_10495, partial [Actinomycetota bacterium]|nr:hypothetical protein [Actinomycetota bacterium]
VDAHRSGIPLHTSSRQNPSVLEREHLGGDLQVGVVVHDRHPVLSCQHGAQQLGDAYRSVPPRPGQCALRVDHTLQ